MDIEASNIWYPDTACSNHITGRKELFTFLDESSKGEINFGIKQRFIQKVKVILISIPKMVLVLQLFDVFYVLDLYWNLLSLGPISDKGHKLFWVMEFVRSKVKMRRSLQG